MAEGVGPAFNQASAQKTKNKKLQRRMKENWVGVC
jgi:hypothetical protein